MTDKITSLGTKRALKSGDNRAWTPVECLLDCAEDIRSGATECDKLLILRLNTKDGATFDVGCNAAQLKASEIIAVLEVAKAMILEDMGYID